jgi:hypothetical protein
MVVGACGDERRLVAHTLLELEPEDAGVEVERAFDVSHLEVDVADVHTWIDQSS